MEEQFASGPSKICLDAGIDVEKLQKLDKSVCRGIAKSRAFLTPAMIFSPTDDWDAGTIAEGAHPFVFSNLTAPNFWSGLDGIPEEHHQFISDLNPMERSLYLSYAANSYYCGHHLILRYATKIFPGSSGRSDCCIDAEPAKHFSELFDFIYNDLPFDDVGYVSVMMDFNHLPGIKHFDRRTVFDGTQHFIWFNITQKKRFYVEKTPGEREYLDGFSHFFNTNIPHGAESTKFNAYSIRVNGQLKKEFCEEHGIIWKERENVQ